MLIFRSRNRPGQRVYLEELPQEFLEGYLGDACHLLACPLPQGLSPGLINVRSSQPANHSNSVQHTILTPLHQSKRRLKNFCTSSLHRGHLASLSLQGQTPVHTAKSHLLRRQSRVASQGSCVSLASCDWIGTGALPHWVKSHVGC
jgi:hypothetical protein